MTSLATVWTAIALLVPAALGAAELTAVETRGKQFYLHGIRQDGSTVSATLRMGGAVVSGALMNCASCHGYDGRGRPESGVTPSSIRWDDLTKPYNGHTVYDEASLRRAIARGIDPAGKTLGDVMPSYPITEQETADLAAYLKRMGASDPGLSDSSIRVGVFLPPAGDYADAIRAALNAYFTEMNSAGGVYDRRIDAKFVNAPVQSSAVAQSLRGFLKETQPFLLVGSYLAGAEDESASILKELGIPLVGGLTLYPPSAFPLNRYVFYLYGGVPSEAEALASYVDRDAGAAVAIVYAGQANRDVARAVQAQPGRGGWLLQEAASQNEINASLVLLLCPPETAQHIIDRTKIPSRFFIPGSLADASLLARTNVTFAFSTAPDGHSAQATTYYRNLAAAYRLPPSHPAAQLSAMTSARVMQEALIRAGREVSRERLVDALENLNDLQTGLGAPVTFGPNRRVGITTR